MVTNGLYFIFNCIAVLFVDLYLLELVCGTYQSGLSIARIDLHRKARVDSVTGLVVKFLYSNNAWSVE